jgi:hypothetical protein
MNVYSTTPKVKELTGTRKRDFYLNLRQSISTDSYWDGGSRTQYEVLNIDTGARFIPPAGSYPWTTQNIYTLKPGDVVIATGVFCGKPARPSFSCLPEDNDRVKKFLGIV